MKSVVVWVVGTVFTAILLPFAVVQIVGTFVSTGLNCAMEALWDWEGK